MNLSRLMVLGILANQGPRHGHQIRRDAEQTEVSGWGGVNVGALYRELRTMEDEGLVEPLRTEQVGRRPARTVYQITDEGLRELRILRERAIRELHQGPDTLAVALLFGRVGNRRELIELMQARRQAVAGTLAFVTADCQRQEDAGRLGAIDIALFKRSIMRLESELRWLDDFAKVVAALPDEKRTRKSSTTRRK